MKLCILWHMHQPFYKDLVTGRYEMPWVRLHGTKDYYDMVAILDDFPRVKQTFNLVPSLLEQVEDYGRGEAVDNHLELTGKPADSLTDPEKQEILLEFFKANYETMIAPHKRFKQLYQLKAKGIKKFAPNDWLDLQVWSNLAWIDPMFYNDEPIKNLLEKQKNFTEEDKNSLIEYQRTIIAKIIPKYKEAYERGQIELSVSPYFHPILPLLFDTEIARQSVSQICLPDHRFAFPDDARAQITMAIDYFETRFGRKPQGMWPSEGSVSEQIMPLLAEAGIKWIATDEEILALSLGKGVRGAGDDFLIKTGSLYQPYKFDINDKGVHIFFRDHALSDAIGFIYSRMAPEEAANDFIVKLEAVDANLKRNNINDGVVSIILDGENAWEYFPEDGHQFLKALYTKLSEHKSIETATFSEVLQSAERTGTLSKIHPGSWINHNFNIWIGHPEDNKAWDLLYHARNELIPQPEQKPPDGNGEGFKTAFKEIMIAEGSDWCWWFGDEHTSPDNDRFDQLYRSHLINAYRLMNKEAPADLYKPIRSSYIRAHLTEPVDFINPSIDGKITHYYEWSSAGLFDCQKAGYTMHRADRLIKSIYYGYGKRGEVFLRVDSTAGSFLKAIKIKFQFAGTDDLEIIFDNGKLSANQETDFLDGKADKILEIGFRSKKIKGEKSSVRVIVYDGEKEVEKWPLMDTIPIRPDLASNQFWAV